MAVITKEECQVCNPFEDYSEIIVRLDWGYGLVEYGIPERPEALNPFRGHAARSMQVEFTDGKIFSRWIYPYDNRRHDADHPKALLRFPGAADLLYTVPSQSLVDYAQKLPARLVVIFGEGLIYNGAFPEAQGRGYIKGIVSPEEYANYVDEQCRLGPPR